MRCVQFGVCCVRAVPGTRERCISTRILSTAPTQQHQHCCYSSNRWCRARRCWDRHIMQGNSSLAPADPLTPPSEAAAAAVPLQAAQRPRALLVRASQPGTSPVQHVYRTLLVNCYAPDGWLEVWASAGIVLRVHSGRSSSNSTEAPPAWQHIGVICRSSHPQPLLGGQDTL